MFEYGKLHCGIRKSEQGRTILFDLHLSKDFSGRYSVSNFKRFKGNKAQGLQKIINTEYVHQVKLLRECHPQAKSGFTKKEERGRSGDKGLLTSAPCFRRIESDRIREMPAIRME